MTMHVKSGLAKDVYKEISDATNSNYHSQYEQKWLAQPSGELHEKYHNPLFLLPLELLHLEVSEDTVRHE
jgi:hypothetical protein